PPGAGPSRRPDPLFDPLPRPARSPFEPERNGAPPEVPGLRRGAADRGTPGDLPGPRRDAVPEPQFNGYPGTNGSHVGGPYGQEPHRQPPPHRDEAPRNGQPSPADLADPTGPRRERAPAPESARRRAAAPLPPPGVPAERSRTLGPPPVPNPTSPDLDVRSLAAGDLAGRRAAPPGRAPVRGTSTGSYAERAGTDTSRRDRTEDGADALPPAPAGSAEDVRLSIFEDLQSEWFTRRDDAPPAASWHTAADEGWRAAARLAEPATAGTTTAGLPRRRPQALYVPGTAGGEAENAPNGAASRSPQEVRGRLSSYRDGVRRGRHAEPREDD
ncbi:MAG: hypothetical protein ACJ73E_16840, partial [Mycobacteriales bacterium]